MIRKLHVNTRPAWLMILILLGACSDEDITRHRVPKIENPEEHAHVAPGHAEPAASPRRTLGAIVPVDGKTWFFKAVGEDAPTAAQKQAFLTFMQSVKFDAGKPTWTLPEGWTQEAGSGMRFATVKMDPTHDVELSVSQLEGDAGGLLANVNRWRSQLNLPPLGENNLSTETQALKIQNADAVIVDFAGMGTGGMRPPFAGAPSAPGAAPPAPSPERMREALRRVMRFDAPESWRAGEASDSRLFTYHAGADANAPLVTVIALPGTVGGLSANINRWRTQVGLGELDDAKLAAETRTLPIMGADASYVELVGPNGQSTVGAMLIRSELSLFFKMTGASDAVAQQKNAFGQFATSMRVEIPQGAGGD